MAGSLIWLKGSKIEKPQGFKFWTPRSKFSIFSNKVHVPCLKKLKLGLKGSKFYSSGGPMQPLGFSIFEAFNHLREPAIANESKISQKSFKSNPRRLISKIWHWVIWVWIVSMHVYLIISLLLRAEGWALL